MGVMIAKIKSKIMSLLMVNDPALTDDEEQRLTICIATSFILSIAAFITATTLILYPEFKTVAIISYVTFIGFLLSGFLFKKKVYMHGKILLVISGIIGVFFGNGFIPYESNALNSFYFTIVIPFLIFNKNEKKFITAAVLISITLRLYYVFFPVELIQDKTDMRIIKILFIIVCFGAVIIPILFFYLRNEQYKEQISKMNEELEASNEELEAMNEELEASNNQLIEAKEELEAVNKELALARDNLWSEMELARKIQTVLLPRDPTIPGYEILAHMTPADEVGGDYYDIINVGGMDWVVIGDVSGHGVPAGLVMMMVQTAIHAVLDNNPEMEPSELLTRINRTISSNIKQLGESKYMTITVLAAHKDGKFTFSGLHQDILVYRASSKQVDWVETSGMWIGLVEDIKGMIANYEFSLNLGDAFLLYTDGITEARDEKGNMFSTERLAEILISKEGVSLPDIKERIFSALNTYKANDDITFVAVKRVG